MSLANKTAKNGMEWSFPMSLELKSHQLTRSRLYNRRQSAQGDEQMECHHERHQDADLININ